MEEVLTHKEQIIHDIENTPIILFMNQCAGFQHE